MDSLKELKLQWKSNDTAMANQYHNNSTAMSKQ